MILSIRTKLMIVIPVLLFVLTLVMTLLIYGSSVKMLERITTEHLSVHVSNGSQQIDTIYQSVTRAMTLFSQGVMVSTSPSDWNRILHGIVVSNGAIEDLVLFDTEGHILAASRPESKDQDYLREDIDRQLFERALKGGRDHILKNEAHRMKHQNLIEVNLAMPVFTSKDGAPNGVLFGTIRMAMFGAIVKKLSDNIPEGEGSYLINHHGDVLPLDGGEFFPYKHSAQKHFAEVSAGRSGYEIFFDPTASRDVLVVYGPILSGQNIENLGWSLITIIPTQVAFAEAIRLRNMVLAFGIEGSILMFAILFFLSGSILNPIKGLILGFQGVVRGRFVRLGWSRTDELGELSRSFDAMVDSLQKTTISKDYLDNVIEAMLDGLVVLNPEGEIQIINAEGLHIFGYENESELIGKNITTLVPSYSRTGDAHIIGRRVAVEGFRKDGSTFPLAIAIRDVKTESGHLFVAAFRDITVEKKQEEELATRISDLERFQKITMGREMRVIELKAKLRKLEGKE